MTLATALREYAEARRECDDCPLLEHDDAKKRLHAITDPIAEIEAATPEELMGKLAVLRDAIPFRSMRWDDLRPYRLVASVKKDAERLIGAPTASPDSRSRTGVGARSGD